MLYSTQQTNLSSFKKHTNIGCGNKSHITLDNQGAHVMLAVCLMLSGFFSSSDAQLMTE